MGLLSGNRIRKTCQRWDEPWHPHELTFSCFHRRAFLGNDSTCEYLAEAITRAKIKHQFHLWGYVFMPEHVHLLVWATSPQYSISAFLQTMKQSVSRRTIAWLRRHDPAGLEAMTTGWKDKPYQFWQDGGGYDRNVTRGKTLLAVLEYIHNNPVKRGLISLPERWRWSSAADWAGIAAGPVPLDKDSFLESIA